MIINTESTVDYNNKLKQAAARMKLGINNEVDPDTKTPALNLWEKAHQTAILPNRFTHLNQSSPRLRHKDKQRSKKKSPRP